MTTITLDAALTALGVNTPAHKGEFHLAAQEIVNLNDDGITWTKIPNIVGNLLNGFSVTTGTLKKTVAGSVYLFNGVSDLEVNKACTIFYGLALNGNVLSGEITKHTFSVVANIENIGITALADLSINDEIEIWAKGDGTAGIIMTIDKLDVTFLGE